MLRFFPYPMLTTTIGDTIDEEISLHRLDTDFPVIEYIKRSIFFGRIKTGRQTHSDVVGRLHSILSQTVLVVMKDRIIPF